MLINCLCVVSCQYLYLASLASVCQRPRESEAGRLLETGRFWWVCFRKDKSHIKLGATMARDLNGVGM